MYAMLLATIYNVVTSQITLKSYEKMLTYTDQRISLFKDVIEGIKSIKYFCWESIFD